ncbi:MAG: MBL fold metallo-hydrolase [Acidimicrobiaceae bacterium]|nr:MBL fold metallo-hydrolase [Ilumatobacter sp.]MCB9380898.1 MBL fold metallo-hydrolase [Acidimicrobiaceae bacterium]MCO5329823.1 MBL fold metallo-hydrolase [Ilumatobacteraceae bacterium]
MSTPIPYVTLDDPHYGEVVQVSPLIQRVIAKNPSKFTYLGTGTYIVGTGERVAVIDPGPPIQSHRTALLAALEGRTVAAILVTHCHSDHSPLAAWLKEETGAPTVAFGPHKVNLDWVDDDTDPHEPDPEDEAAAAAVAEEGDEKVEESLDLDFTADVAVADGALAAELPGCTLRAIHTPGHTSNHLCFWLEEEQALFSGDHIMGWSTTVITPPDGDMRSYFESLHKVAALPAAVIWPTHGAPVLEARPFIDAFVAHRLEREAGVLAAVRDGVALVPDIVRRLYVGVPEKLYRAAGRSVLSHLIKLAQDGLVQHEGQRPGVKVRWLPA